MSSNKESPTQNPFARLEESNLTPQDAINLYQKNGFLWIRLNKNDCNACHSIWNTSNDAHDDDNDNKQQHSPPLGPLQKLYQTRPDCITHRWAVENRGDYPSDDILNASAILGGGDDDSKDDDDDNTNRFLENNGPFYVSAILQKDKEALQQLYSTIPFLDHDGEPSLLKEARHDDGCWLFLGRNPPSPSSSSSSSSGTKRKHSKRKALAGRAEHVDEVSHSGTFHIQILGTKTWLIRPNTANATSDWQQNMPDIKNDPKAERSEKNKAWRLRIHVEAGDLFVLNTRAWYHRTELEEGMDGGGYSLSVARDFYLNDNDDNDDKEEEKKGQVVALIADRNVKEGEVIFDEEDLPDDFVRSDDPNCSLAEIADEEEEGDDDDEDNETRIALVALRDIKKGEALTIASDDNDAEEEEEDEDYDSDEHNANEKMNAADGIDPRAIANRNYTLGETVLESSHDIPEDLPCSTEPNCELVEEEGGSGGGDNDDACIKLRALCDIQCGDILTLAPDEDEEYEEAEVRLDTHEFVKS